MDAFDVAVVGAGPAGAIAARDLARRGARVALVDGSHPREKPCGGGVTGRALALAGSAANGLGRPIDAVRFEAAGRSAGVRLNDRHALAVFSRADFDAALVRQAADAGANVIAHRAAYLARDGSRWAIRAGTRTLHAPWLLGADGAGGIVRKHVFRPFDRGQLSIAAGSFVD